MSVPDFSYLGSGRIYLRDINAAPQTGFLEVGNVSAVNFQVTEDVKTLVDYTTPGGGVRNEVRRISAVEMSMTATDLNARNLSRALNGSSSVVAGGTARTNQALGSAGVRGGYVPIPEAFAASPVPVIRAVNGRTAATRANTTAVALNAFLIPAAPNGFYYRVSTAGTTAAAPPTFPTTVGGTVNDGTAVLTCMGRVVLTPGTDYELRSQGILIATGAAYTDLEALEADYTTVAMDVVQSLVTSGREFELLFDGVNEARSGKRVTVRAYRVRLGVLQNLGLIGDEYASMEITGKLLADTTQAGGLSQYFRVTVEQ